MPGNLPAAFQAFCAIESSSDQTQLVCARLLKPRPSDAHGRGQNKRGQEEGAPAFCLEEGRITPLTPNRNRRKKQEKRPKIVRPDSRNTQLLRGLRREQQSRLGSR